MRKKHNIDFSVINILNNPRHDWTNIRRGNNGDRRFAFRKIDVDWKVYNTKDYLFTHDSIVCSVATEKNGYTIVKPCEDLINANGNAWTNEVLLACFKTFVGAENYQEHVQVPALSKGKVLDAIIRPVKHKNELGEADIYVVDILVATNRKHETLVSRIESGDLKSLSMGCIASHCQCSICGEVFGDNDVECDHIKNYLGRDFICDDGVTRKVAELCGACDKNGDYIPDSCRFIEASWVEQPAFKGAVVNYFVETNEERVLRESKVDEFNILNETLFSRLKVADRHGKVALNILRDYMKDDKLDKIANKLVKKG